MFILIEDVKMIIIILIIITSTISFSVLVISLGILVIFSFFIVKGFSSIYSFFDNIIKTPLC